jgi:hypothetical protein
VAKNGFRNDDFAPLLYRTTDLGRTWSAIHGDLPASPINVVVQDARNPRLLVVGNDRGVWVSLDGGGHWQRLEADLPPVPVHDLTIHPREHDLVLGTYGRGVFVGDISHLQQLTPEVLGAPFHLFDIAPRPFYGFRNLGNYNLFGDKYLEVPNEPEGLTVMYSLRDAAGAPARVTVSDIAGRAIATLDGPADAGINRVLWNMREGGGAAGGRGGGRGGGGAVLPPGSYKISVTAGAHSGSTVGVIRERGGK